MSDRPVADGFPEGLPVRGADDAFGRMVWDYHRGDYDGSAVYRSWRGGAHDGLPEMYFSEGEFAPETAAALELVTAAAAVGEADPSVVDIGCGPGQHARELREREVSVLGVDPSDLALRTARERGLERVLAGDLTALPLAPDAVDAVLMCGTQLGVAGSIEGLRTVLRDLDRVVRAGGRVVADIKDPVEHAALLTEGEIRRTDTDDIVDVDADRGVGRHRMRTEYDGTVGPWVELLLLTPGAAARAVEPTPWRLVDTPGADEGSRYYLVLER